MRKKPLKIFLGDLTYDTISISTDSIPLNIGYIASYCIDKFGQDVEISLFKYIDKLDKAINDSPPNILALSNYCWNQHIDLEMFRILSKVNPYALKVWGGPNFPLDLPSQKKFFDKYNDFDIYVPIDGEVGFSNIVKRALEADSEGKIKEKVMAEPIEGCIFKNSNTELQYSIPVIRIKNLDQIPSPYLNGILDEFFDGRLSPMIQTNRGCPFTCTFCVDGSDEVRQVNRFGLERVISDINYIGKNVSKNTHTLIISDLNFAMFPRDLQICDAIAEVQRKYNYPHFVSASTGKNAKEKVVNAIKRLKNSLQLMVAVQSMDRQVLSNIRRENISIDHMMALAPAIKEAGLSTKSEVILALPGETFDSHIKTLKDMVRAKMDDILVFTCMLLPGSELDTPKQRKMWNLKTKFRILPRDFASLSNGKKVLEIEECVVETNTLSFEEYTKLRVLSFVIFITSREIVYDPITKLIREQDVDVFELYNKIWEKGSEKNSKIHHILDRYMKSTTDELWNSPEEIQSHYQDEKEYKKLLSGEDGINVFYHYRALVTAEYITDWTEYTLEIAYELLKEKGKINAELNEQFDAVSNYCRGIAHNPLGKDRMLTNPEYMLNYDIKKWMGDDHNLKLKKFKLDFPVTFAFKFTNEQYQVVQDYLDKFGEGLIGKTQTLTQVPSNLLWRKPVKIN
jgi:radical SAM superfamily enzyme YgiQ (UPF0313 family)